MYIYLDPNVSDKPKVSTGTISGGSSGTFTFQSSTGASFTVKVSGDNLTEIAGPIPLDAGGSSNTHGTINVFTPIPGKYHGTWDLKDGTGGAGTPSFTVNGGSIGIKDGSDFVTASFVDCREKTYSEIDELDDDPLNVPNAKKTDYPDGYMMNGTIVAMTPSMSQYGFQVGNLEHNLIPTFFLHKDDPSKALVFTGYDGTYGIYEKQ